MLKLERVKVESYRRGKDYPPIIRYKIGLFRYTNGMIQTLFLI